MISIEQIRAARGLLGWSQTQLADAASRSLPTIKRLEREHDGGAAVSGDVREAVQRALEKQASSLFRKTEVVQGCA